MAVSCVEHGVVCLLQLDSRIESLTARQRERQPTVERPRTSLGSDRPSMPLHMQGAYQPLSDFCTALRGSPQGCDDLCA